MNKAFEKILERLEENTIQNKDSISFFKECGIKFVSACKAKEIVQEVAEEYNNGWIPCSERLPERNKDVLCWVKSKTISGTETYIIGSCDNGFWFLKTYEIDRESFPVKDYEVIAWKQLPEPYKESEKDVRTDL